MKKLLTTSAIVVALSAPAIAQTTVTGNLDIAYKAFSNDLAASKTKSGRGFHHPGHHQAIVCHQTLSGCTLCPHVATVKSGLLRAPVCHG